MNTTDATTEEKPLSSIFEDSWDVFTVDTMDGKAVAAVLNNASPPQNSEHVPTLNGIRRAATEFCDANGAELLKAIQLFEGQ